MTQNCSYCASVLTTDLERTHCIMNCTMRHCSRMQRSPDYPTYSRSGDCWVLYCNCRGTVSLQFPRINGCMSIRVLLVVLWYVASRLVDQLTHWLYVESLKSRWQGSGKSHTVSCLLECSLIKDNRIGSLPEPLAGIVYDLYIRFRSAFLLIF